MGSRSPHGSFRSVRTELLVEEHRDQAEFIDGAFEGQSDLHGVAPGAAVGRTPWRVRILVATSAAILGAVALLAARWHNPSSWGGLRGVEGQALSDAIELNVVRNGEHKTCLDVPQGTSGAGVVIAECRTSSPSQAFIVQGAIIRWKSNPSLCLMAGAQNGQGYDLRIWTCNDHNQGQFWTVAPTGDNLHRIHMKAVANMCISNAPGPGRVEVCPPAAQDPPTTQPKPSPAPATTTAPASNTTARPTPPGPSLLCLAVCRAGYESNIFSTQLIAGAKRNLDFGIFACNDFDVYSASAMTLGTHWTRGAVVTRVFQQAGVGTSKDGTAANTALFMNFWNAVKRDGKYLSNLWTVKVDPDCVLMPDRLRWKLQTAHLVENGTPLSGKDPHFLENCNKYPGLGGWPMMFGSLEVFSQGAMRVYYNGEQRCRSLDWYSWGEDVYMATCLKVLNVHQIWMFDTLSDKRCNAGGCSWWGVAFHDYKSPEAWFQCWEEAVRR